MAFLVRSVGLTKRFLGEEREREEEEERAGRPPLNAKAAVTVPAFWKPS